ncbi:DUF1361 domain-containing protein [Aestuariivivens insulae]|uniref:DUF1361 domain-containing protein n=1 Tax=Aestuariivivens insulae TaxID=1621988 RepID=UPI001F58F9C8|nr:DUF1361 domain-containing protein [Aestuariivivens insulae]
MEHIKQLLFNRFKTFALITSSIFLSTILLMVRLKLTHSLFLLFLVWNLFLATIPFAITTYLICLPKPSKKQLIIWFGIWLLFLPNAPYMVTDLIHLRLSEGHMLWLDIIVINAFAFNGLLLYYLSVLDMKSLLTPYISISVFKYFPTAIFFLSSFGIYLGRFLRYNSWELLSNPKYLLMDILDIFLNPLSNRWAWLFTLLFGLLLIVGSKIFKHLFSPIFSNHSKR